MPKKKPSEEFNPKSTIVPQVTEADDRYERSYDVFSRLLKDRVIMLPEQVNEASAAVVIAQLLFLSSTEDPKKGKTIDFYIMSPGGDVDAGMAIYDTMQYVKSQGATIRTFALGRAMSMGSVLLVGGSPGHRFAMPSARIMLHEPSGGSQGKSRDMDDTQREINHMKHRFALLYEAHTNLTYEGAMQIMDDEDFFARPEEAKKLGLIDEIIYPENDPAVKNAMQRANRDHEAMRSESSPGLPNKKPGLVTPQLKPPKAANQP